MNTQKYKWILYFIVITIITTIAIQFYWNFKNYEENKQRVANEIQLSLDNAVEEYYSSLAKSNFLTIIKNDDDEQTISSANNQPSNTLLSRLKNKVKTHKITKSKMSISSIEISSDENFSPENIDSLMLHTSKINSHFYDKKAVDSIKLVTTLKPIIISFLDEQLDYNKIDSLIEQQLSKKGIALKTSFHHIKNDTLFKQTKDLSLVDKQFSVTSKSTYLKDFEAFELYYSNANFEALKRGFGGIFLSLLLSLLIISCLFYLLKIIQQQKELAAIKNDLISNITHEFKTPIATVSTAIEAIESFNVIDDKQKTQKYLAMSSVQLKKLHQMVEKLLETATLDSEQLLLKKETTDVVAMTEKLVNKYQLLSNNKTLIFSSNVNPISLNIDVFHFENVVSNLIDNAIKYGGNTVEIHINSTLKSVEISIADDGDGIEKNQQEKIFDKFYRVPKGNTHDVKGFGIGLYYCKKIVEKHHGILVLSSNNNQTIFKITLPHV
jgi:two-component system phosphate regulon sensor histidine kinase PhoR